MENKSFSTNTSLDAIKAQYEQEQRERDMFSTSAKKNVFDEKNYLQARLKPDEKSKTLTIRLLPFSPDGGTPFQKVHMHTVRVNKEISPSGWKTFVCPINNKKDGELMGDKCPFCETSKKAREFKFNTEDEATRKKYGDIEFMNKPKEMWIVRCIERGHEEDGVKFWLFNTSKEQKGPYDQMMNLANLRAEQAAKKGNKYNIFDVNNGLDLVIMLTRTSENKTTIQVLDSGFPSPLTEDFELGESWIKDDKKWYEVYTVKPYDYMSIVVGGGVPVFDKDSKKFFDKEEMDKIKEEAARARLESELTEQKRDYSEITNKNEIIIDGMEPTVIASSETSQENNNDEFDLPF